DRAACDSAWAGKVDTRQRGDRQFRAAGPDHVGRRGNNAQGARKAERSVGGGSRRKLRQGPSSKLAAAALRQRRRDCQYGGLCRLPGSVRHQRRRAARRGRHRQYDRLRSIMAAYVISEVEVHDPARWETYRSIAARAIAQYGGRYLVRGGAAEAAEGGPPPKTLVIVEFPSMARLREWYGSPEYAEALA